MNEITNNVAKKHSIHINYNQDAHILGVLGVISYDANCISLKLSDNTLTLSGDNFNIEVLNLDNAEIKISGNIHALAYNTQKAKVGFFKKLIK